MDRPSHRGTRGKLSQEERIEHRRKEDKIRQRNRRYVTDNLGEQDDEA